MNRAADKFLDIFAKDLADRKEKKLAKIFVKNISDVSFYNALIDAIEKDSASREIDPNDPFASSLKDLIATALLNGGIVADKMKNFPIDIQKRIVRLAPELLYNASDEIKNDKEFIMSEAEHSNRIYNYIGDDLRRDKEFMLSLKDKSPRVFAQSSYAGYFELSDEEAKAFYKNYPNLLDFIPPKLFEDELFITDVIDSFRYNPSLGIGDLSLSLDFDALKLPHVQRAVVRKFGYHNYKELLYRSVRKDIHKPNSKFKNLSPEEQKEFIFLFAMPVDERLVEDEEMKKFVSLMEPLSEKVFASELDSPKKMAKEVYNLSSKLGKNISYDEILKIINENYNELKEFAEDSYDHESPTLLYNILLGIENKNLSDLCVIFEGTKICQSPYIKNLGDMDITPDNIAFLKCIANTNILGKDASTIDFYKNFYNKMSTVFYDPNLLSQVLENLDAQPNLANVLKGVDLNSIDKDLLINIVNYIQSDFDVYIGLDDINKLRNYNKFISDNASVIPKDKSIVVGRDFLFMKYAGMTMNTAQRYIHFYFSASVDDEIYQMFPEALALKDLYEKVKDVSTMEELNNIQKELESMNFETSLNNFVDMSAKVKDYFEEELRSSISNFEDKDKIYDMSDKDFKMLIHVVGAYGFAGTGTAYEAWNTERKSGGSPTICASFISNGNMGTARYQDKSIVFGFHDLPDDYVEIMSCRDLFSYGFSAERESRFMNADELIDNTRNGHNEIVIRRTNDINGGEKVQPSYIVCFDQINDESRQAAKDFGVPIVFIDRKKVASIQRDKIVSMVEEFEKNPTPELLNRIIVEQENNKAGFRLSRPDLMDEYFGKDFRQANIDKIYSVIEKCPSEELKILCMQQFVLSIEKEIEKSNADGESAHRKNPFDVDYQDMVEKFKNDPNFVKNVKIDKYEELLKIGLEKLTIEMEKVKDRRESIEREIENESKRSI